MFDAGRRPSGRLFYWWMAVAMIAGFGLTAFGSGACPAEWTGDDHDRGYSLSGGREHCAGKPDYYVAGVSDRKRSGGCWGHDDYDAGCEWGAERGAGAECGRDSGGGVLHGGVPAWPRRGGPGDR